MEVVKTISFSGGPDELRGVEKVKLRQIGNQEFKSCSCRGKIVTDREIG